MAPPRRDYYSLSVRLTPDELQMVRERSAEEGVTQSDWVDAQVRAKLVLLGENPRVLSVYALPKVTRFHNPHLSVTTGQRLAKLCGRCQFRRQDVVRAAIVEALGGGL